MKKIIIFISLISLSLTTIKKDFHITIIQNGKQVEIKNGTVKLDNQAFDIMFELSEPMGVLVNGSFDKKTYKLASKGKLKTELPGFKNTGMAEGRLNADREIFLNNVAPNYWYYDTKEDNRFNATEIKGDKIRGTRTIEKFWDMDTDERVEIKNIKKTLYLVFISTKYENGKEIEHKREFIKIKWNK